MRFVYIVLNLECWKCARTKLHCANCLVVLRNCSVAHLRGNTGCELPHKSKEGAGYGLRGNFGVQLRKCGKVPSCRNSLGSGTVIPKRKSEAKRGKQRQGVEDQGPDMGKCRPGASRKVPPAHSQWRNQRFEPGGKTFLKGAR